MSTPRPELQQLLRSYHTALSRVAREGHSQHGRGAVVAIVNSFGQDLRAGYHPERELATPGRSILARPDDPEYAALFQQIREYDPEREFVLFLETRTPIGLMDYDLCRVGLAPGQTGPGPGS